MARVDHSTMRSRLDYVQDAMSLAPMSGNGRIRRGLGYLRYRLATPHVFELPPPIHHSGR
ncbi:hypothetical protein CH289_04340 [Rhodococcus sp. RS1C4]|nr:hypothetical protein CH289_04340 [Rhodococcus sp. RS1C4]